MTGCDRQIVELWIENSGYFSGAGAPATWDDPYAWPVGSVAKMRRDGMEIPSVDASDTEIDRVIYTYLAQMRREREAATAAARALRAIPSEARSEASRENGKKGGRPKKKSAK